MEYIGPPNAQLNKKKQNYHHTLCFPCLFLAFFINKYSLVALLYPGDVQILRVGHLLGWLGRDGDPLHPGGHALHLLPGPAQPRAQGAQAQARVGPGRRGGGGGHGGGGAGGDLVLLLLLLLVVVVAVAAGRGRGAVLAAVLHHHGLWFFKVGVGGV